MIDSAASSHTISNYFSCYFNCLQQGAVHCKQTKNALLYLNTSLLKCCRQFYEIHKLFKKKCTASLIVTQLSLLSTVMWVGDANNVRNANWLQMDIESRVDSLVESVHNALLPTISHNCWWQIMKIKSVLISLCHLLECWRPWRVKLAQSHRCLDNLSCFTPEFSESSLKYW